jgi:hypothetical protein
VKCFCNAKNTIPNIQDIEIINAFQDEVSDIKTIEEIVMKKLKMMANVLVVTDICIESSEARSLLLDSCNKGPPKKKQQEDGGGGQRSRLWESQAGTCQTEREENVLSTCRC